MKLFDNSYIFFGRKESFSESCLFKRVIALNSSQPYKFAFARTALKYGLISLGLQAGDSLLVPELICESALVSLNELGIVPQYYPVNSLLEADFDALKTIKTKSTKGLLIVHYFGQPQNLERCLEYCRKNSIYLIEDNAHGFGGTFNGQLLGTFGSIGICSLRKSFPILNGAYLYIASGEPLRIPALQLQPHYISNRKHYLKYTAKHIPPINALLGYRKRNIEFQKRLGPPPPYHSQQAFREATIQNDYGMDNSAEEFLHRQNIDKIREVRHKIYYMWRDWSAKQGLTPVFPELSSGAMPLIFPAYTGSADSSRNWFERGHRAGVDIHSWPTLPMEIVLENRQATRIWERMVCFPIHQGMDIDLLVERLKVL